MLAVFIVLLGSFVVVSPVGAVDSVPDRITSTVPVRVSDSRPGKLTMKDIGSGVKHLFFVNADGDGSASMPPCGSPAAGETNPNSVSVKLSEAGTVCLLSDESTDLLADVAGFTTSTPTQVVTLRLQRHRGRERSLRPLLSCGFAEGRLAQPEERHVHTVEVGGSRPPSPTQ